MFQDTGWLEEKEKLTKTIRALKEKVKLYLFSFLFIYNFIVLEKYLI